MNQSKILALIIFLLSVIGIVFGTNICENAPCEPQINASIGDEFAISFESNPSTGFEWWTKFDPNYLSLTSSTLFLANELSGMVGISGKQEFTFSAISAGNTDVVMLLLQPGENGTIAERKIFPVNILSDATKPKQTITLGSSVIPEHATIRKSSFQSSGGMATNTVSNGQTMMATQGTSSSYFFKNESVMETPTQSQHVPDINDLSPHGRLEF
jgi:predicted secreted protein